MVISFWCDLQNDWPLHAPTGNLAGACILLGYFVSQKAYDNLLDISMRSFPVVISEQPQISDCR